MPFKMRSILFLVILIVINQVRVSVSESLDPDPDKELRLVHIIFRHGQRTPILIEGVTYPNDIHKNYTYYPYGIGELTNEGKAAQYKLGQYLRERYDTFLGELYQYGTVLARSSDFSRTFMSCSLVLAGMWPTKGTVLEWNPNLNWSPIPIKIQPIEEDTLFLGNKKCPRYQEEFKNVQTSSYVLNKFASQKELVDKFNEVTGVEIKNFLEIMYFYDIILSQEYMGLELPEDIKSFYHEVATMAQFYYEMNIYNDIMKRIKMGKLLKQMIEHWTSKSKNELTPPNRKIFIYSAHDLTIANFLLAIDAWQLHPVNYSDTVMLELYEDVKSNEYSIRILYKTNSENDPTTLTINGCEKYCPLSKVQELTKHLILNDWDTECKIDV